jgi:hypothetical protein
MLFAALHESASGPLTTGRILVLTVAFGSNGHAPLKRADRIDANDPSLPSAGPFFCVA